MRLPRVRKGRQDPKLERLAAIRLLSECSRSDLERIAAITVEVDVPAGKVLTKQGESGHEFFVIEEGTATAAVEGGATARMGPGECFGELALLNQAPRSVTVTAETDMRLAVLDAREFGALMDEVPSVARGVLAAVAERLQTAESPQPHH